MTKVYRNVQLMGVISKKRAVDLLGLELSVDVEYKGYRLCISRDDMGDIDIDYYINGELAGGQFEAL